MFICVGFRPPLQFGARDQDRKFSPPKRWEKDKGGHTRPKTREVMSEEKRSQKRREVCRGKSAEGSLESEMSGDYSNSEGSVGPEADFVNAPTDTEVDLRLPLEVDMQPDQLREDVPAYSGAVDPVDLSQDEQCRNGPDTGCRCLLIWQPRRQLPGATAEVAGSGTGRRRQVTAHPTYPGPAQRRQRDGIKTPTHFNFGKAPGLRSPDGQLPPMGAQFEPDPFGAYLPRTINPDHTTRRPAGNDVSDPIRSPGAVLIIIIICRNRHSY